MAARPGGAPVPPLAHAPSPAQRSRADAAPSRRTRNGWRAWVVIVGPLLRSFSRLYRAPRRRGKGRLALAHELELGAADLQRVPGMQLGGADALAVHLRPVRRLEIFDHVAVPLRVVE